MKILKEDQIKLIHWLIKKSRTKEYQIFKESLCKNAKKPEFKKLDEVKG